MQIAASKTCRMHLGRPVEVLLPAAVFQLFGLTNVRNERHGGGD